MRFDIDNLEVGVVGLGYVGLPDTTLEVDGAGLAAATKLRYASDPEALADCNSYVVTALTLVGEDNRPVLAPLEAASVSLSKVLQRDDIVVHESTVCPGATEEFCVPVLKSGSGLSLNEDFYVGYSLERINPGDKEHTVSQIRKVTSGSTSEAAKVIENTQRDVNIPLVNELAMIFERVGVDTEEVLEAAGTKWNFLPFQPGLVGGHCIGVDPYYLTYKAQQLGYHPQMILAGRRINDDMPTYIVSRIVKNMIGVGIQPLDSRVLILGLAFKENCPDVRNSKVIDVVDELSSYGVNVDVHDPWVDPEAANTECGVDLVDAPGPGVYDVVVVAVSHRQFAELGSTGLRKFGTDKSLIYDVKYLLPINAADDRL